MLLQNLRQEPAYSRLAEEIRSRAEGKKLLYVPNTGNWGDALIHRGTLQFLEHFEIDYSVTWRHLLADLRTHLASVGVSMEDAVLLAGGGGAWCNHYTMSRDFVRANCDIFSHTIVLPTTYELGAVDESLGRVTYFRRDESESAANVPGSVFCHDMALFLKLEIHENPNPIEVEEFFRGGLERHESSSGAAYSLDVSALGNDASPIEPFFKIVARAAHVRTDRLHVAIAAAMLGRSVELYPSKYFKAKAVYESSLKDLYANVTFRDW
jgi:CDP-glycerol glycerophosphotransferase